MLTASKSILQLLTDHFNQGKPGERRSASRATLTNIAGCGRPLGLALHRDSDAFDEIGFWNGPDGEFEMKFEIGDGN
jgi:hypothetical protein